MKLLRNNLNKTVVLIMSTSQFDHIRFRTTCPSNKSYDEFKFNSGIYDNLEWDKVSAELNKAIMTQASIPDKIFHG